MNVIEELTESRVDRAHVERRLDDWMRTIDRVYGDVVRWLPAGWRAWKEGTVPMHEELMHRFGIPEQQLPVLQLRGPAGRHGWMEPRGLWIVGANGRIDLILPPRHFLLVNREDSVEPQRWLVSTLENRRDGRALDESFLSEILA